MIDTKPEKKVDAKSHRNRPVRSFLRNKKVQRCTRWVGALLLTTSIYLFYYMQIPSRVSIPIEQSQELSLCIPASASIETDSAQITAQLDKPVKLQAGKNYSNYQMQVKLLGVIPLKNVEIQVVEPRQVYAMGTPIGIYVKTKGVMVVDVGSFINEEGFSCAPAEHILEKGDYILQYDDKVIDGKKDFLACIGQNQKRPVNLTIERDGQKLQTTVQPQPNEAGDDKMGIWIRDNAQGVGTLTYTTEDGSFGALGHGITDADTGELLELSAGSLYDTTIVGIRKGVKGTPGELTGMIAYDDSNILGQINQNTQYGIYGNLDVNKLFMVTGTMNNLLTTDKGGEIEKLPVAMKQEIQIGPAQILCSASGERMAYDVRIDVVHMGSDDTNKGMELTVTDPTLLELTGGIVQGLSGSPIIQNGKFIGAVTHVFIENPEKGYGIFAETMLIQ